MKLDNAEELTFNWPMELRTVCRTLSIHFVVSIIHFFLCVGVLDIVFTILGVHSIGLQFFNNSISQDMVL